MFYEKCAETCSAKKHSVKPQSSNLRSSRLGHLLAGFHWETNEKQSSYYTQCNVYSFSSSFLPSLHKSTFAVLLPFGSHADLNRFFLKGKEQSLKFSYKVSKLQKWQLWYKTNKGTGVLSILKTGLTAFQKPGLEKVLSSTECLSIR